MTRPPLWFLWLAGLALLVGYGNFFNRYWYSSWGALLCGVALLIALMVGAKINSARIALALAFSWISALVVVFYKDAYSTFPLGAQSAIRQVVAASGFSSLLLVTFFALLPGESLRRVPRTMGWVGLALTAYYFGFYWIIGRPLSEFVPFIGNPSMGGVAVAILSAFYWYLPRPLAWLARVLTLGALLAIQASTPLLVFLVAQLVPLAVTRSRHRRHSPFLLLIPLFALAGVVGFAYGQGDLLSGNGRFPVWQIGVNYWRANHFWFGAGTGTTQVLLPMAQLEAGENPNYGHWALWMHSDYLQAFFELGVIGASLWALAFVEIALRARRSAPVLGGWLAFMTAMLTDMPIHWPFHALIGVAIAACAYRASWVEIVPCRT